MQHVQHATRTTAQKKTKESPLADGNSPVSEEKEPDVWTIRPDKISRRVVRRAMRERPGVTRTFIVLEQIKNSLCKKYGINRDEA